MKAIKFLITFLMLVFSFHLWAETIKVTLPLLPPVINQDRTGVLVDLIRLMDEEYSEGVFKIIGVSPFQRSVANVGRNADVHWPSLEKPGGLKSYDIMYSTETFYKVNFVLYTKKGREIALDNLANFKIGTQIGQAEYFPFKTHPKRTLEGGLKMVDNGRLDGFIFSMFETDFALKKTGLETIERNLYGLLNVKMILPNNERGRKIDRIISQVMIKLRANGKYEKLMGFLTNARFKK